MSEHSTMVSLPITRMEVILRMTHEDGEVQELHIHRLIPDMNADDHGAVFDVEHEDPGGIPGRKALAYMSPPRRPIVELRVKGVAYPNNEDVLWAFNTTPEETT